MDLKKLNIRFFVLFKNEYPKTKNGDFHTSISAKNHLKVTSLNKTNTASQNVLFSQFPSQEANMSHTAAGRRRIQEETFMADRFLIQTLLPLHSVNSTTFHPFNCKINRPNRIISVMDLPS